MQVCILGKSVNTIQCYPLQLVGIPHLVRIWVCKPSLPPGQISSVEPKLGSAAGPCSPRTPQTGPAGPCHMPGYGRTGLSKSPMCPGSLLGEGFQASLLAGCSECPVLLQWGPHLQWEHRRSLHSSPVTPETADQRERAVAGTTPDPATCGLLIYRERIKDIHSKRLTQ